MSDEKDRPDPTEVRDQIASPDSSQPPDLTELEEVFASIDPTPARMARDLLVEAGVEAFLFDAAASRMLGSTAAIPARLMVHRDKIELARTHLKNLGFIE